MTTSSVLSEFKQLYKSKNLPDCEKAFICDGIINPELFAKQQNKVLFIAKEHNLLADTIYPANEDNYIYWWNLHVHLQFSHRISEWAYGIQNDFSIGPEKLSYDEKHHALKSIAFINAKNLAVARRLTQMSFLPTFRKTKIFLPENSHKAFWGGLQNLRYGF